MGKFLKVILEKEILEIPEKEFKGFEEQDLIKILECGYCQKTAFEFQTKFFVSWKFCRETFCKNCHKFVHKIPITMFSYKKLMKLEKNYF